MVFPFPFPLLVLALLPSLSSSSSTTYTTQHKSSVDCQIVSREVMLYVWSVKNKMAATLTPEQENVSTFMCFWSNKPIRSGNCFLYSKHVNHFKIYFGTVIIHKCWRNKIAVPWLCIRSKKPFNTYTKGNIVEFIDKLHDCWLFWLVKLRIVWKIIQK